MAAATPTSHDAIIKDLFPWEDVVKAFYENNPLGSMVAKKYDRDGKNWHNPIRIAYTMGRSRSFANAKANKKGSNVVEMQITVAKDYSLYAVDGLLAAQTRTNKGAFVEAFEFELEAAMDAANRNQAISLYRNYGGAVGQVAVSGLSTTSLTLLDINDVVNFEVGDLIGGSAADGTSGSLLATGSENPNRITAINSDTGVLTGNTAWTTAIGSLTDSYYLFKDGDWAQSIRGMASWLPGSAPTSGDSFFGLDRSVHPQRLSGARVNGAGLNPEEQLQKGVQVGVRNGAKLSHCFMNDLNFLDLELSLGSRVRYTDTKTDVGLGFSGIKVRTGNGEMEVYADPNCPHNVAYLLSLSDWELGGPHKFPEIESADGTKLLREDSADSFEGRIKIYNQLVCRRPHRQVRLALA